mmetsp:Transcript_37284/g.97706  ORF Transcript_37284/g.97706 Transcript_37284/m.97706 type:complete len:86 (-) Transcript_37284:176-433(-)
MSSPNIVRVTHGWILAWTDFYQAPLIVTNTVTGEIKGFLNELSRKSTGSDVFPHNKLNPSTDAVNRLGRPRQYNSGGSFRFGNPY